MPAAADGRDTFRPPGRHPGPAGSTSVDLPTPEWPISTEIRPAKPAATRRGRPDRSPSRRRWGPPSLGAGRPDIPDASPRHHDGEVERGVIGDHLAGLAQVGLGQQQHRIQVAGVGGDQAAVDEPRSRRRVGQCGHDDQLVGRRLDSAAADHPLESGRCRRRDRRSSLVPLGRPGRSGPGSPAHRRCRRRSRPGRRPPRRGGRARGPAWPPRRASRPVARTDSVSTQPNRPRSTEITIARDRRRRWPGRVLVRGRLPRARAGPGRRRCPSGRRCRPGAAPPGACADHAPTTCRTKLGQGLGRACRCRRRLRRAPAARRSRRPWPSDDRRSDGHTPPCSWPRLDEQAVGVSSTAPPSAVMFAGQGREPVGLVAAEVTDAAQPAGPVGEQRQRGDGGVSSPTSCRSTSMPVQRAGPGDGQPGTVRPASHRCRTPIVVQDPADRVAGLGGRGRPTRYGHTAAGDRRRGQERGGVGQVGFDPGRPRRDRARRAPARSSRAGRRPRRRPSAAPRTVIWMCGSDGTGSPSCATVTPVSYEAPDSSRPETNWRRCARRRSAPCRRAGRRRRAR